MKEAFAGAPVSTTGVCVVTKSPIDVVDHTVHALLFNRDSIFTLKLLFSCCDYCFAVDVSPEVEVLMQYLNAGSLLTQCHGVNELFNGVFWVTYKGTIFIGDFG